MNSMALIPSPPFKLRTNEGCECGSNKMENYSSDSSSDYEGGRKQLDLSHLSLDPETLDCYLEENSENVEIVLINNNRLKLFPEILYR